MPELIITIPKEGGLSCPQEANEDITAFLMRSLPISAAAVNDPRNELIHMLLGYHSEDGGAISIAKVNVDSATYDAETYTGKINFRYYLAYHYACSYSETNYEKQDKIDFKIDPDAGIIILTFLDMNTRSTADEF